MIQLQSEVRPVAATITSALSHLYTRAGNKNIIINIDCAPLTAARHDYKWTSEALFNLLENAVKYTEPGGSIRITAEGNEMFTRIEVADTGIGIPEDGLEHIFKRFYRGHNAGEYEGIGIGLFWRKNHQYPGRLHHSVIAARSGKQAYYLPPPALNVSIPSDFRHCHVRMVCYLKGQPRMMEEISKCLF